MTRPDNVLDHWRSETRRRLPDASNDLVEEIAVHLADRWTASRDAGASVAEADGIAFADLNHWHGRRTAPSSWRAIASGLTLDLASGWRLLRVRPVASLGTAALVAMATAALVGVFAVVNGVLLRPLPYAEPDRLVTLWQFERGGTGQISYPDYVDVRDTRIFAASGAMNGGIGTLVVGHAADRVHVVEAEPSVLSLLGARPLLGRLLNDDDGGQPRAVISHRLWQTWFGADAAAVGRTFLLSGQSLTIIGVLSAGFDLELPVTPGFRIEHNDVWMALDRSAPAITRRDVSTYEVLARLAPGQSMDRTAAAVASTAARLQREWPSTNGHREFRVVPLVTLVTARGSRPLAFAIVAAALVVLIALANLTTLAIGRLTARLPELAVRRSLGASRWRIARQLALETCLVTAIGGALGVLAGAEAAAMASSRAANLPRLESVVFDGRVAMFALTVVVIIGVAPGVIAWRVVAPRRDARQGDGRVVGGTTRRARRMLVASEVALAIVFSTGAAVLALALVRLIDVDPGFSRQRVLTMRVSAYAGRYPTREKTVAFFVDLAQAFLAVPGVEAASAGSGLPLTGQSTGTALMAEEHPEPPASRATAGWQVVLPGYFATAGIPILRGRDISAADRSRTDHVAILNQSAARLIFGDADPIGRRVSVGGGDATGDWHEVIGVVGDVRQVSLSESPGPRVYDVLGQHWGRTNYLVVRAGPGVDAASLESALRSVVASADRDAPMFDVRTTDALVRMSVAAPQLAAALAVVLALVSVVLALVGVFAVVACSVSERMREIGVRVALGASTRQILKLVLGEVFITTFAGTAVGVAGGIAVGTALETQVFGVGQSDAAVIVALSALGLLALSLAAAWRPAVRAASTDPLVVMRGI